MIMTLAASPTQPAVLQQGPASHAAAKLPASKLPVIDGRRFLAAGKDVLPPLEVAEQIAQAGKQYGAFQLVNHGVDEALIQRLQHASEHFFALPEETKLKVDRTRDNHLGYSNKEFTKQILDIKETFDFQQNYDSSRPDIPGLHTPNRWPAGEDEFKEALTAYLAEMSRVGFKLLETLSMGLGLSPRALFPAFQEDKHTTMMRLNYYPAVPEGEQRLALNEHTDVGFVTILLQDPQVEGLEVQVDGVWHKAPPLPNSFTVNFGDTAQILSNDIYKAANHRVIAPKGGRARYSAPVFFTPSVDAVLQPLPEFVTPDRPAAYRPVPWTEFMGLRVAGNYEDLGEEVQLHHYRIDARHET